MADKLKILRLEIVNYKRINVVQISPKDNIVEITGKNEAGKSSVIDAIEKAISGKKKKEANKPLLRKGQEKGKTFLVLGRNGEAKYEITRSFTTKGDYLTVQSTNGAQFKSPQAFLSSFISDLSFDPLEFANADPGRQKEMLLSVVDIPLDAEELHDRSGVSVPDVGNSPIDVINAHHKAVYDKRAIIGRDVERLKGSLDSIEIPDGMEGVEPVSISDLMTQKDALDKIVNHNEGIREDLHLVTEGKEGIHDTVRNIKIQIAQLQEDLGVYEKRLAEAVLREDKLRKEVSSLTEPDFAEINEKIEKADENNKIASQVSKKKETEKEYQEVRNQYDDHTRRLERTKAYKSDLLSKMKFPIDGLGFDEHGFITLKGVPISEETTATSTRIKLGLAIGEALNPKLGVITIKEGNDLDKASMDKVKDWAKKKDMQVWIERVKEKPDALSFYIEDGTHMSA